MRERVQTHGTRLHSDWEGWFLWLLSLIRRAIKEVEWPTKRHIHTHTVLSGDGKESGLSTHKPLG